MAYWSILDRKMALTSILLQNYSSNVISRIYIENTKLLRQFVLFLTPRMWPGQVGQTRKDHFIIPSGKTALISLLLQHFS